MVAGPFPAAYVNEPQSSTTPQSSGSGTQIGEAFRETGLGVFPAAFDAVMGWFGAGDQPDPKTQAQTVLQKAGVKTGTQTYSYDDIIKAFQHGGIDTSQPAVQIAAQGIAQMSGSAEQQLQVMQAAATSPGGLLEKYPAERSSYSNVVQTYGLQDILDQYPTRPAQVPGQLSHVLGEQGVELPGKPKPFVQKGDATVFANGVIYVPGNAPIYPIDSTAAGSPLWLHKAQQSWGAEKVQNWREELYKLGYQVSKKGGWDQQLIDATNAYYTAKYSNLGKVVPTGAGPGGTAAGSIPKPVDLHRFVGGIQSDIIQQYRSVFNADPTPDELQSWTNFVIRKGMDLQKGPLAQRLTPSAAQSEAEARAATRLYNSPQADFLRTSNQENTSLHQGLVNAIAATNGIM